MLRTHFLSDGRTDNVKTVYPPTNTVCGGYNNVQNVFMDIFALTHIKVSSFKSSENIQKQETVQFLILNSLQ